MREKRQPHAAPAGDRPGRASKRDAPVAVRQHARGCCRGLVGGRRELGDEVARGLSRLEAHLVVLKNPILALQKVVQQAEEIADNPTQKGSTVAVRPDLGLSGALLTGTRPVLGGLFTTVLVLYFLLVAGDIFLRRIALGGLVEQESAPSTVRSG
jgi:hypothetical protein